MQRTANGINTAHGHLVGKNIHTRAAQTETTPLTESHVI